MVASPTKPNQKITQMKQKQTTKANTKICTKCLQKVSLHEQSKSNTPTQPKNLIKQIRC